MKRLLLILLVVAASATRAAEPATAPSTGPGKIRVSCVGDSITYGAGLKDRHTQSYPSQLQNLLGDSYTVQNFGISGTTAMKKSNRSYWDQKRFKAALESTPDIVIIKLGTNDSKPQNWAHKERFHDDYTELVKRFVDLPTHPRVWLCRPIPALPGAEEIQGEVVEKEIIPIIDTIAKEQHLEEIDLHAVLADKPERLPDKIHPDSAGAHLIAAAIAKAIQSAQP